MDPAIARRLVALNRDFYEGFAGEFSASRVRLHDGILEVFRRWDAAGRPVESLVDLGCGDARVGRAWIEGRLGPEWNEGRSRYLGVDFAPALLHARGPVDRPGFALAACDVTADGGAALDGTGRFTHAVSFSVLHHVPGDAARARFVRGLRDLLAPGGHWAVSVWQIAGKPRFADRILPWSTVGLDAGDLDPGDLLVDWRQGGTGRRYVHEFERSEIRKLFENNGLLVDSDFSSDGRSGDLGLYLIGRRA